MMNWRIGAAVVMAAGLTCGYEARAQMSEEATAVLTKSAEAITKVAGVSYKAKLYGLGPLKDLMDGEGEVKQLRVDGKWSRNAPVWVKASVKEMGKGKSPVLLSTDGIIMEWIDDPQNTHFKRPASDRLAQPVYSLASQVLLNEFVEQAPYTKQFKAQSAELKPNEQIHGVDCQVVLVSWEGGLRSELWWIGANDHLPRKVEMAHGQNRDLAKGTEIWDLQVLSAPTLAELALKTPAGYKEDFQTSPPPPPIIKQDGVFNQAPVAPPPPVVIGHAPGTPAPEFDLKSGDGESVKLSSLRGKVVVLTFGGTIFPKTDRVNATVGEVIGGMKDKGVQAFTLACREPSEQAAIDHAKKAGFGFPVLLSADNVRNDYKVAGFPTTYVLTGDGKVSKVFQGSVNKEQLEKAIDTALKGEVDQAADTKK